MGCRTTSYQPNFCTPVKIKTCSKLVFEAVSQRVALSCRVMLVPPGHTLNDGYAYACAVQRGGISVLDWLCAEYRHSARETWAARLAAGEVTLDGQQAWGHELLRPGQLLVWHRPPWPEENVPLDVAVLHQDAELLAVHKPAGLPTMPGGGFLNHTLLHVLRQQWPTASPLHRLGRGTSGVVLCALTSRAACR